MNANLFISLSGAVCLLTAFIGVQEKRLNSDSLACGVLNFVGAGLLGVSAISPLNVGILIVECFWSLVSLRLIVRLVNVRLQG